MSEWDGGTEGEETFRDVDQLLAAWRPGRDGDGRVTPARLRAYLESELNADATSRWEQSVVETRQGSLAADVVVDGEVAVALLEASQHAMVRAIRRRFRVLSDRYNYVVGYWLEVDEGRADMRRTVERSQTAGRLGIEGITFRSRPPAEQSTVSGGGWSGAVGAWLSIGSAVVAGVLVVVVSRVVVPSGLGRLFLTGTGLLFVLSLGLGLFLSR